MRTRQEIADETEIVARKAGQRVTGEREIYDFGPAIVHLDRLADPFIGQRLPGRIGLFVAGYDFWVRQ